MPRRSQVAGTGGAQEPDRRRVMMGSHEAISCRRAAPSIDDTPRDRLPGERGEHQRMDGAAAAVLVPTAKPDAVGALAGEECGLCRCAFSGGPIQILGTRCWLPASAGCCSRHLSACTCRTFELEDVALCSSRLSSVYLVNAIERSPSCPARHRLPAATGHSADVLRQAQRGFRALRRCARSR